MTTLPVDPIEVNLTPPSETDRAKICAVIQYAVAAIKGDVPVRAAADCIKILVTRLAEPPATTGGE